MSKIKFVDDSATRINSCVPFHFQTIKIGIYLSHRGFGGLEVSVLASCTQVRGFKPGRSRRIFRAKKILSTPSFGGEVKPSVPCRNFTACKITQKWSGSRHFRQNSRCWDSLGSFQTWGTPAWRELEHSNHWSSKLGVWRAAGNGTL